jgi:hypothetical protein
MTTTAMKPAKHYARLICDHLKQLPDQYADDPEDVRSALGLSEAEFQLGLNWCVERKIIDLEIASKSAPAAMKDAIDELDITQDAPPVDVPGPASV